MEDKRIINDRESPAYVYGLLKDDIDRGQINNDGRIEMH